jgi:hypothetical protein
MSDSEHAEVRAIRAALDAELGRARQQHGDGVEWSPQEAESIRILLDTARRRSEVRDVYHRTVAASDADPAVLVKLSGELRQLDKAITTHYKAINADMPAAPSITTQKARKAANVRWTRQRERDARNAI